MKCTDRKILFFDIDGTLITEDGRRYFPDSARKALAQARANGHLVFVNTGRVYCNVTDEIKSAGFDGFVCGCGTSIYYDGRELFHNDVSKDACRNIAYACRRYDMYGMYEHRDKVYVDAQNMENELLVEMVRYFRANGIFVGEDVDSDDFEFDKFCCWFADDNAKVPEFREYVSQYFDYIDIPLENAYAFGDGNNDAPMLLYCPNSIIMQKGPEELKRQVMLVTDDAENDGIYNAMVKLGIIEPW